MVLFSKSKVTALRMPAGFGLVWVELVPGLLVCGFCGGWLVGWLADSTVSQVEARDASACGRGGGIQCGEVGEVGWGGVGLVPPPPLPSPLGEKSGI